MAKGGGQVPQAKTDPYAVKERYWRRWGALKTERASWDPHAMELARNLLPRASRFTATDRNRGGDRHNKIYDNTALKAVRILGAGMMSGNTSPARPWFRLKTPDDDLMKYGPVNVWCSQVTRKMLDVFARSNTYRSLHSSYIELAVFGTHANIIMPDFDNVIHATPLTWGEYAVATNAKGVVDTLYREFQMTAKSMVEEFGADAVSQAVRTAYDRGSYDDWFTVVHAMQPRADRDDRKLDGVNMPVASCYFEPGGAKDKWLREGGFKRFPALCPRWQVNGQDIYGESPGMEALGDAKQLQHEQLRKGQGIDYMTKPPVYVPTAMKGQEIDLLPGGVSYIDSANPQGGMRQAFEVKLDLNALLMDIQDVRQRIDSAFYADLFLMLSNAENTSMTATEVAERHEEKLLMLGPVLERLQNEQQDPLIDMTFERLLQAGALPPPPPELSGMQVDVELVSMLAQAQRAVQTNSIDRFATGAARIAQLGKPEALDKIDGDMAIELYADSLGVDPRLLVDDKKVQAIRQGRAQAQAQAAQQANASAAADAAAKLGAVPTQGGTSNAGADAIGMFSGYQSPQAERLAG